MSCATNKQTNNCCANLLKVSTTRRSVLHILFVFRKTTVFYILFHMRTGTSYPVPSLLLCACAYKHTNMRSNNTAIVLSLGFLTMYSCAGFFREHLQFNNVSETFQHCVPFQVPRYRLRCAGRSMFVKIAH